MKFPLKTVNEGKRECGGCTVCCSTVGVHEFDKPIWTPCIHQKNAGCGIYETRPASCQTFYCLYQGGFLEGDERRRPDNLGIMFTAPDHKTFDMMIAAWEVRPGALGEPSVQWLLTKLKEKFVIYIYPYKQMTRRYIMGKPEMLAEIDEIQECS